MDRSMIVRTGVAGAVAGIGLSVGGVAMANADTGSSDTPGTSTTQARPGPRDGGRLAATLAKQLGVSEAKVKAALAVGRAEARATERAHLKSRLDAAVKAGTLTEADEASVLKAFDADVLGGRGGGPGGPPPPA